MGRLCIFRLFCLVALLLLGGLAACGTKRVAEPEAVEPTPGAPELGSPTATAASPLTALPAPLVLLRQLHDSGTPSVPAARTASYVEADLIKAGNAYSPTLPKNHVAVDGADLAFSPVLPTGQVTIEDVAYAIYYFRAADYDRNALVRLDWSIAPTDPANYFVALANWDDGWWNWFAGTGSGQINVTSMDPYFTFDGDLLAVVAVMGPPSVLHEIRLGGLAPVADLGASKTLGPAPFTVDFTAMGSRPVEGSLTKFEWDIDEDGIFETDTGLVQDLEHTYAAIGEYHPRLRVTNSLGLTDEDTLEIQATGEWQHTWGLSNGDKLNALVVDEHDYIYAVGTSQATAGADSLLLLCLAPSGVLHWARTWDGGSTSTGTCLALDDNGNVIVGGYYTDDASQEVFVQQWSADGDLIWSRRSGGTASERAAAVLADGADIYIAGFTMSTPGVGNDFFACHIQPEGTLHWAQVRDHGATEFCYGMCFRITQSGTPEGLILVGSVLSGLPQITTAWKVEYNLAGVYASQQDLGAPAIEFGPRAVIFSPGLIPMDERYYIAGVLNDADQLKPAVICTNGLGDCRWGKKWWSVTLDAYANGIVYADTGLLMVSGWMDDPWGRYGLLWGLNPVDGGFERVYHCALADGSAQLYGLAETSTGLALAGQAANASGVWEGQSGNAGPVSAEWVDSTGDGGEPEWDWGATAPGIVADVTAELLAELDTGAGQQDAFIAHRLPE